MRVLIALAVISGFVVPAIAQEAKPAPQTYVISLTKSELDALVGLVDAGVKAGGLRAVPAAASVMGKLQSALTPKAPAAEKK